MAILPHQHPPPSPPPPAWTPAPEPSHAYGQFNEASEEDCDSADLFCELNALEPARLLPSSTVDQIAAEGCRAWGLTFCVTDPSFTRRQAFQGTIHNQSRVDTGIVTTVETTDACKDCCLISALPFICGLYHRPPTRDRGVYFELTIHKMNGVIAIGTICRPYPHFRLPGWHRRSAALHLDDMRKFYERSDGGQESGFREAIGDRLPTVGDTVGCGYGFGNGGTLFFTFNGDRLAPDAFRGLYPIGDHDVYGAVGVDGESAFTVNFGGGPFEWLPGNAPGWRVDGHVGRLSSTAVAEHLVPSD